MMLMLMLRRIGTLRDMTWPDGSTAPWRMEDLDVGCSIRHMLHVGG